LVRLPPHFLAALGKEFINQRSSGRNVRQQQLPDLGQTPTQCHLFPAMFLVVWVLFSHIDDIDDLAVPVLKVPHSCVFCKSHLGERMKIIPER
jgi:hypothetical protein